MYASPACVSERKVSQFLADDESGLEKTKVGGRTYITEKAIQLYERQL